MFKKLENQLSEPISEPTKHLKQLLNLRLKYSIPKLYIPRKNGRATLDRRWYVYFYYDDPITGKRLSNNKFMYYNHINTYTTIAQRREFGKRLVEGYTELLAKGWNPYENRLVLKNEPSFTVEEINIKEAIEAALVAKERTLKKSSYDDLAWRLGRFLEFAEQHKFANDNCSKFNRFHVVRFLESRQDNGENATSINNYRTAISSVITQMVNDGYMEANFVRDIPRLKTTPVKNHPFTELQIKDIQEFLEKEDPLLLDYIRVLAYSFLRNSEVATLKVGDVDLRYKQITASDTKTKAIDKIYIIEPLQRIFERMQLDKYDKDHFIFTPQGVPGEWASADRSKRDYFSKRFRKVKDKFGFGDEYGIYSFRHSF